MPEHILFLTGKLAEKSLHKVLESMQPMTFSYDVRQLGVTVAALMTTDMIQRRLNTTYDANRIVIPGRCRGDIEALSAHLGAPVERGPEELKDLPSYFGVKTQRTALDRYDVQIFAEIVDAPNMHLDAILSQAERYRKDGANVIDLGCLPNTPFPLLERAVKMLKDMGFSVSIDSMVTEELLRGGHAGADFLLSLKEDTLWVADEVDSKPVLIPTEPADLASLFRAMDSMTRKGKPFIADPILDPIHAGFTDALLRYHRLRERYPNADILMGVGNLTELTHADTGGINALLMGIVSELRITHVLTTEVSEHCRKVVRETDLARRIMYAARASGTPPQHIDNGLMSLHERKPFPYDAKEVREFAQAVKDPNYRIQVTTEGVHIYNRDDLHSAADPFELYSTLDVEGDAGHAFYLGVELARAQVAWQLGKRYNQDEALNWGCAVEQSEEDLDIFTPPGPTFRHKNRM